VSVTEARQIFARLAASLTSHARITLIRAFDKDNGTYDYTLLLQYMRA